MAGTTSKTPGAAFIDPHVLARIDNLALLARTVVDGFINGLHRSPYFGLSLDFAEHRGYMPGDDTRWLDWRVYARTDRYYVKQFEAESNANFSVLLDISRSMRFGSAGLSKLDYGRFIAACLTYFAHRQRDRVGLVTFDDGVVERVPPSAKHLEVVLHTLERIGDGRQGHLLRSLERMPEFFKRRGIVVIVSDLYEDPQQIVDGLKPLVAMGNDVIVFHVLDRAEIEFPYDEASSFQDLETGEVIPVVPDAVREQYRTLVREHIAALDRQSTASRIDYSMLDSSVPLDYALFRFLAARERLGRVRG